MRPGFTGRIARASAKRPWLTVTAWVLTLGASVVAAGGLSDVVTQDERMLTPTEYERVIELDEQFRSTPDQDAVITETVVIRAESATFGDPEFAAVLDRTTEAMWAVPGVTDLSAPTSDAPMPVSDSGTTVLVSVSFPANHDGEAGQALLDATEAIDAPGFTVLNFGELTGEVMFDGLAEDTLMRGELIGISVAIVILLVVFGALAAAGVPLLAALVSIITAVGATAIVGRAFELSFFVLNMVIMMGLALGIDYTLVMVQRFREELAAGRSVLDAVAVTGNTANRAIFFSGVTVLISLVGLLVVPSTVMRSLGAGAMIVATMAVITALTLLPAVLALMGHRVNKGRVPFTKPQHEPRVWNAIAGRVIARPAIAATVGVAILATLAIPALSMRLTFPGLDSLPEDNEFRQAANIVVDDFGYGNDITTVAIENASGAQDQVDELSRVIDNHPAFAETTVEWVNDVAFIDTKDVYDAADIRAEDAVKELRSDIAPSVMDGTGTTVSVGGAQAEAIDFTDMILGMAPIVLSIVLGASFILLMLAFRSIVIPLKSIVLNLLSVAASLGVLAAVFQYGWGSFLGLPQVDGIAPWIPLFLFAVLFGLSMDYHVFLLSRIKERYEITHDTADAVKFGLGKTGSLITGAALIMVAVFSGFALGDLAEFTQMGVGLAAAIIIDATVVRALLVPALITLLDKANWYLPRWLEWLPSMHVEAPPEPALSRDDERELEPALVR